MSKKKDLKIEMSIVLDRKAVEKNDIEDSMKTVGISFGFLIPQVTGSFRGAIEHLKKTGKLRWPATGTRKAVIK